MKVGMRVSPTFVLHVLPWAQVCPDVGKTALRRWYAGSAQGKMSGMRSLAVLAALLWSSNAAAQERVTITVDGTMVVGDNVRVGGSATRGAVVALHSGKGCRGDAIASSPVEDGGRFTVAHNGSYEPPFAISVRAANGSRRSECVDLEIPAARKVAEEKPAPPPPKKEEPKAEAPKKEEPKAEAPKKEEPKAEAPKKTGLGMCIGQATSCGVLPKGICYMQQGCSNPIGTGGFGNDRCVGTARGCMYISSKNMCQMQRGCIWSEGK